MILSLAWKNIWRNKLRSGVILFAITLGLYAGVFVASFTNGMVNQLVEDAINIELTHLRVNRQSFVDEGELKSAFAEQPLLDKIDSIEGVKSVSPRLIIQATASTAHNMGGVQVIGVDPARERAVNALCQTIPDSLGSFFDDSKSHSIVIGSKFAEKYKVKLRSKIVLSFADMHGESFAAAFRVCGIYRTNNPNTDLTKVYLQTTDLRTLSPLPKDSVHELAIRLTDNSDELCIKVQSQIQKWMEGDEIVRSWKEINPVVRMYNNFMGIIFIVVIVIILFALGFGIVNTVLMSVMERKRELSMLIAIGMSRKKVMVMIIGESTILTMLGGTLGLFLGVITVLITHRTGIDMSSSMESFSVVGISSWIYPVISVTECVVITVLVFLTGVISALYPAKVAIQTRPAEGIKS